MEWSDRLDELVAEVIAAEGGYVNDPADRGGETNMGITAATARTWGYMGDMRDLPRAKAEEIYRDAYYLAPHFDRLPVPLDALAFDWGVHSGPHCAVLGLQTLLNERRGKSGRPMIAVDGRVGLLTEAAVTAEADLKELCLAYQQRRRLFLEAIAARSPEQRRFLRGWLRRVEVLTKKYVDGMPDARGVPF